MIVVLLDHEIPSDTETRHVSVSRAVDSSQQRWVSPMLIRHASLSLRYSMSVYDRKSSDFEQNANVDSL